MSETQSGPYNAQFVPVESYSVGSWRDGPVGSDVPVTAVVLHLAVPERVLAMLLLQSKDKKLEGSVELGLRIKSRRAVEQMVRQLQQYADEVWPPDSTFAP